MSINQSKLLSLLPGYDGQDAATVAAALSVPTITVAKTLVTAATLGLLWGDDGAANFIAGLSQLFLPPSNRASYYSGLLYGNGIDFGDSSVRAMADSVAVAVPSLAPAITQLKALAEARTYACDDVVTADDVAAGRIILVRQNAISDVRTWANTLVPIANALLSAAESDASLPVPTRADYLAILTAGL